jgi:hypothetical protein
MGFEDENEPPDVIRSPQDVARRALALYPVMSLALGAPRPDILEWLDESGLGAELTPRETLFIEASSPTERQIIDAGWRSEALVVLCWALGQVTALPGPAEQCDTAVFEPILPPFAEISPDDFIAGATLRPDDELLAMADAILALHWEARNAKLKGTAPRVPVDGSIIQERHHAINWVIGYDGAPWDDVTTDT